MLINPFCGQQGTDDVTHSYTWQKSQSLRVRHHRSGSKERSTQESCWHSNLPLPQMQEKLSLNNYLRIISSETTWHWPYYSTKKHSEIKGFSGRDATYLTIWAKSDTWKNYIGTSMLRSEQDPISWWQYSIAEAYKNTNNETNTPLSSQGNLVNSYDGHPFLGGNTDINTMTLHRHLS